MRQKKVCFQPPPSGGNWQMRTESNNHSKSQSLVYCRCTTHPRWPRTKKPKTLKRIAWPLTHHCVVGRGVVETPSPALVSPCNPAYLPLVYRPVCGLSRRQPFRELGEYGFNRPPSNRESERYNRKECQTTSRAASPTPYSRTIPSADSGPGVPNYRRYPLCTPARCHPNRDLFTRNIERGLSPRPAPYPGN